MELINYENCNDPYSGLRIAEERFNEPYLQCTECDIIALAIMRLLVKYAYTVECDKCKFTIGYVMKNSKNSLSGEVESSTICKKAISVKDSSGNAVPNMDVYNYIYKLLLQKAERYNEMSLSALYLRIYYYKNREKEVSISPEEIYNTILVLFSTSTATGDPPPPDPMRRKRCYPNHVTELKLRGKKKKPFIVADTETILQNDVHIPYAVGFMVVKPGEDVKPDRIIETYFSEDYFGIPEFEERSNQMMSNFLERLVVVATKKNIRNVYFHNFSRFDGIILMKYYASHGDKYNIKPLMRNHMLFELSVYQKKKIVLSLRDSYTLLPSSLATLGKTLCPQLGGKGSIQHDKVRVENLIHQKEELVDYMKQDIRLLGGIMMRAQDIYFSQYKVDIVNVLTVSSLAMSIYRMSFYDSNSWPIHIPSRNQDKFIRKGYFGGHTDVYKPYGENLYYYDVNSLYPYIMKTFPMPGGVPVWHHNLVNRELSELFGFIEAYVECPSTINQPFLPYRDDNDTLLFPTGKFVGVYYSEELIYARDLGYKITPLRGYLFEKMPSPFDSFVSSLYRKRQEAKKAGDDAMAYVYKILMNSLYGRWGISPKSTITEVCDKKRYDYLTQRDNFIYGNKLSERYYIVGYASYTEDAEYNDWNPPRISAVQLAAAITACARIHMYKYISRPDCYYTDTDSVILENPLPEDEISSIELGKLKMEHFVKKGVFLAPKSYTLITKDAGDIIKHKGPAKGFVDTEWFNSQYADLSRIKLITVESNFRIDWRNLNIVKKDNIVKLGIKVDSKRDPIYDNNNVWVDTQPKEVIDYKGQELSILKLELKNLKDEYDFIKELSANKEKEYVSELAKLREEIQSLSAKLHEEPAMNPLTDSPTGLEQPTLYNISTKAKGKKAKVNGKKKPPPLAKRHTRRDKKDIRMYYIRPLVVCEAPWDAR